MSDEPFYAPNRKAKPEQAKASEQVFEFQRGHDRFLCELRDHGRYGVEAQFWKNEEFLFGRRFDTRTLAAQWAWEERKAIEKGGA